MSKVYNIAIDGPAGAGKSTIARAAAVKLGFVYVDTGAMYRAMALYFMRKGISADENDHGSIAAAVKEVEVTITYENGVQQVYLNGENVSSLIREEEVSAMASAFSVYMPVREKLVELQKELARKENIIMDGRDIGTCVLPAADLKIYLTATCHVRAVRRYEELRSKEILCDLEEIEQEIAQRDYRDMHRDISPLKQAEDAVLIDTSDMLIEEVISDILNLAAGKGIG